MIKFRKNGYPGLSAAVVINEKVRLYAGVTDHWGFAVSLNLYDNSFTIEVLRWYFGIEVWHRIDDEDEVN